MGLPSRTFWARTNIDVTQQNGFAASAYQLGASYFSWGNVDGHNANGDDFSPFDWGNGNNEEPYSSSPGASITYPGSLDITHDCARVVCGAPWTVPDSSDFIELAENCDYIDADGNVISDTNKLTTIDGVVGIRLRSKINGNILFFAACGYGAGSGLLYGNTRGLYWFSSLLSDVRASRLTFDRDGVQTVSQFERYHGLTVRPIFRV